MCAKAPELCLDSVRVVIGIPDLLLVACLVAALALALSQSQQLCRPRLSRLESLGSGASLVITSERRPKSETCRVSLDALLDGKRAVSISKRAERKSVILYICLV